MVTTTQPQLNRANVRSPGKFSDEEFVTISNVPVFAEHEATVQDHRRVRFGRDELQKVCDRCNERISTSGDYAAITIGHTPNQEAKQRGAQSPPVIGFAGPFRVGTIGEPGKKARYAILADFHVYRKDADLLKRYPRRSPELWLEKRYEDMFLDPIALLGAELPRLDMGLLYSAVLHRGGRPCKVERYAAEVPGPMNSYTPNDEKSTQQYAEGEDSKGKLSTDDIGAILEALFQTEEMKFLRMLMQQKSVASREAGGEAAGDSDEQAAKFQRAIENRDQLRKEEFAIRCDRDSDTRRRAELYQRRQQAENELNVARQQLCESTKERSQKIRQYCEDHGCSWDDGRVALNYPQLP